MNPGHEDCPQDSIEERVLGEREPIVTTWCLHEHKDPVYAQDLLGDSDLLVADHCLCCGEIMQRRM